MSEPLSHTPQPPAPLPHIYVDEKKRSKFSWFGIILLTITILSIPIGVYLVGQRTNILPQAATQKTPNLNESINLHTDKNSLSDGEVFPVKINFDSPLDEANLVAFKVKFPPKNFEIVKIATDSSVISKWVNLSFDNQEGQASIVGGIPNPGLKTTQNQTYSIATLFFRAKGSAKTSITLENPAIYRNSDNQNILKTKTDLNLTLNFSSSSTPPPPPVQKTSLDNPLGPDLIISPNGGEVYSYYKTMPISWNPLSIKKVQKINLYINGSLYGELGKNLENTGKVLWQPSSTLLLPLISNQNTFQIELVAEDKSGSIVTDKSQGPFGLVPLSDFTPITSPSASLSQLKGDTNLDLLSKLFSNYNLAKILDPNLDFNSDGVANDIDLYLIRKNFQLTM